MRDRHTKRPRRRFGVLVLGILVGLLVVPATAFAGSVFNDVDDAATHAAGIAFMKQSGVSIGCDANNYCPDDPVSRAQMATFMYRLSGHAPGTEPSVFAADSGAVDGFSANELVRIAYGQDDSLSLAGVSGTAVETSITAPIEGFLVIRASSEFTGAADDTANCQIELDGAMIGASRRSVAIDVPAIAADDCATDVVAQVGPGEHTIEYVFLNIAATSVVDEAAVTVLFVPFNANGIAPSQKGN